MTTIYLLRDGATVQNQADWGDDTRPMRVSVFQSVPDTTLIECAHDGPAGTWPRTTVGALRAWLRNQTLPDGLTDPVTAPTEYEGLPFDTTGDDTAIAQPDERI